MMLKILWDIHESLFTKNTIMCPYIYQYTKIESTRWGTTIFQSSDELKKNLLNQLLKHGCTQFDDIL